MTARRRTRLFGDRFDSPEIPLSPLIDCVFLLLIFFLVTSMLKRKETLIPINLPDPTSALAAEAADDTVVIGIGLDGGFLEPDRHDRFGALAYQPGGDLGAFLDQLLAEQGAGAEAAPLRLDIARETPFQATIDAIDVCTLRGFTNVSVRILDPYGGG